MKKPANGTRVPFPHFIRLVVVGATIILHIVLILTITIKTTDKKQRPDTTIFKVVDLQEYIPPPPEPKKEEKIEEIKKNEEIEEKPEEIIEVPQQEDIAEEIIETEKEVKVVPVSENPQPLPVEEPEEIEYLPQHKISVPPKMPTEEIKSKIHYPPLAQRQKIEGVVFLELYIDKYGEIRNIIVLKDPGYGLAEAAINALKGITAAPAVANGIPVAVRFRFPIRFKIK
ncbi:MAG TPA: energy transducer TonB [Spirochaetales bacterium]|nr:energy transducer TonB [Spirochaetales bacterium]